MRKLGQILMYILRSSGRWCYYRIVALLCIAMVMVLFKQGWLISVLDFQLVLLTVPVKLVALAFKGVGNLIGLADWTVTQAVSAFLVWLSAGVENVFWFYQTQFIPTIKTKPNMMNAPAWFTPLKMVISYVFDGQYLETILRVPETLLLYVLSKRVLRFVIWIVRGAPVPGAAEEEVRITPAPVVHGDNVARLDQAAARRAARQP